MNRLAWIASMVALLAAPANAGRWPDYVQIVDDPDNELCKAASAAVKSWFESNGQDRLTETFRRAPDSIPKSDLQIQDLTFHVLRHEPLATLDAQGVRREWSESYYSVDIDNDGDLDMLEFVSGGHLRAGEGDTLSMMNQHFMKMAQPVSHEAVRDGRVLEVGPLDLQFQGVDFDNGYYVFPIAFKQRNYLLIEGNGDESEGKNIQRQVIELVPDQGLVGRCFF